MNIGPKYKTVKPAGVAVSSTKKANSIVIPSPMVRAN
jgi:hypothetical protein